MAISRQTCVRARWTMPMKEVRTGWSPSLGYIQTCRFEPAKGKFKAWKYADKGAGKVDLLQLNKTSNESYKIELRFD